MGSLEQQNTFLAKIDLSTNINEREQRKLSFMEGVLDSLKEESKIIDYSKSDEQMVDFIVTGRNSNREIKLAILWTAHDAWQVHNDFPSITTISFMDHENPSRSKTVAVLRRDILNRFKL